MASLQTDYDALASQAAETAAERDDLKTRLAAAEAALKRAQDELTAARETAEEAERSFGRRVEESERVTALKNELREKEDELIDKRKVSDSE